MPVTVVQDPSELAALEPPPPRRRRRWIAVLALALVVALVAGVVVGVRHIWTYQPLRADGGLTGAGRMADPAAGVFTADAVIDNSFGTDYRVKHPKVGTRLGMAFGLTNAGHDPVRILGADFSLPLANYSPKATYMNPNREGGGSAMVPFHRFTLHPGQHVDMVVTATLTGCPVNTVATPPDEGTEGVWGVPVSYEYFGVHHTVNFEVGYALSVQGWPGCRSIFSRQPTSTTPGRPRTQFVVPVRPSP